MEQNNSQSHSFTFLIGDKQNVSSLHECFEINLVTGYRFDQMNPLILQFRYKRRIYTQSYVDDKQLAKLHTKVRAHTGSV